MVKYQKISLVVSLFGIGIGILSQPILPPQIPLFYGLPQTEEQLAPSIMIVIPSLLAIGIVLVNNILTIKLSGFFLKKVLEFTSILISFLAVVTTLKIIFLVGFFKL